MERQEDIKCVVWDLDHTLWDGVLAEGDEVKLRPGAAEVIRSLDARGILHSIASKNDHDDAMAKLAQFELDAYFLFPQIGWWPKSESVARIGRNLNLGLDTLMFIDDEPFERDEVKSEHPDVTCIEPGELADLLLAPRLNPRFVTTDAARRRAMYLESQTRTRDAEAFHGPRKAFLASLNLRMRIARAGEEDLERAEELTVRTNQLNASGRTYAYDELKAFMRSPDHQLLVCGLQDRYGDYGKIGLALIEVLDDCLHIRLLLMSCRVMSLGVGTVLLTHIMREAKAAGKLLRADFRHTGRNRMMHVGFRFANFKEVGGSKEDILVLENDLSIIQAFPPYIEVSIV